LKGLLDNSHFDHWKLTSIIFYGDVIASISSVFIGNNTEKTFVSEYNLLS